jgi:hypothetical protein
MFGPGGLLLVISYLFAVPILVLWVGLEKKKKKIKRVIIMMGSGGLLLVISYLFAVPILVLWVGFGEKERKKIKLGCAKYFCGSHTEQPRKGHFLVIMILLATRVMIFQTNITNLPRNLIFLAFEGNPHSQLD